MKRQTRNLNYQEGSVFLVPLEQGGYATGLVARHAPKGKLVLGYFFGPHLKEMKDFSFSNIRTGNVLHCKRFGDLGLIEGHWLVMGQLPDWKRENWPMPVFKKFNVASNIFDALLYYDDDDPGKLIKEEAFNGETNLPEAGLAGYGFIEKKLSDILK